MMAPVRFERGAARWMGMTPTSPHPSPALRGRPAVGAKVRFAVTGWRGGLPTFGHCGWDV